jgi:hypothetical protein
MADLVGLLTLLALICLVIAAPIVLIFRTWRRRAVALALVGLGLLTLAALWATTQEQEAADAPYHLWFAFPVAIVGLGCFGAAFACFLLREQ